MKSNVKISHYYEFFILFEFEVYQTQTHIKWRISLCQFHYELPQPSFTISRQVWPFFYINTLPGQVFIEVTATKSSEMQL